MKRISLRLARAAGCLLTVAAMICLMLTSAFALDTTQFEPGKTYEVEASLSCYVNAMGGVEFGAPMFRSMSVTVKEDGTPYATVKLGTGGGTIYSVDYIAFVDPQVHPGYYGADGGLNQSGLTYTVSSNSAQNGDGKLVNYVDSITFPLDSYRSTYILYLYVNSNVMGVQFGNGSGSYGSNNPGKPTPYRAVLTVDWGDVAPGAEETSGVTASVSYTPNNLSNTYEVGIPAIISVNAATKMAGYTVTALDFYLQEGYGVKVTADESGSLTNANKTDTIAYTNELSAGTLSVTGDALSGSLTVTGEPVTFETYSGTMEFVIGLYAAD